MLTFEHPQALLALVLLIPALIFLALRIKKITHALVALSSNSASNTAVRQLKHALAAKFAIRSFAWIAFVLALSGITWGTRAVPVQKSGDAVCFVFDISYSMNALDGTNAHNSAPLSRLAAAQLYVQELVSRLHGTSVAVVLAKGDGMVAVPVTEDYSVLLALLQSLSPRLMSAAGSSIGKGIRAALSAFPLNSAQAAHIWVFTDGDETDDGLAIALEEAIRYGVPVTLVGFGSTDGREILAGDEKTTVHTALQEQKLVSLCEQVNKKMLSSLQRYATHQPACHYENAAYAGSAYRLLQELTPQAASAPADNAGDTQNAVYTYEMQAIPRYKSFLLAAILLFALSFVPAEANRALFAKLAALARKATPLLAVMLSFASCKTKPAESLAMLHASWKYQQKSYQQATAGFLKVYTAASSRESDANALIKDYARFGLSATYLMQDESEAALAKLDSIDVLSPACTQELQSAVYYNKGFLAHQQGNWELAAEYFKLAILADNKNLSAKINLELTERQRAASRGQAAETEMKQIAESKDDTTLETGIFNVIKENEQEQWKKLQANTKDSGVIDY